MQDKSDIVNDLPADELMPQGGLKMTIVFVVISVVLLENGEVYTFGSNQYGQLGVGDTNIR